MVPLGRTDSACQQERPSAHGRLADEQMIVEALGDDYWRLRDFEYAQPLYDLAFLLDVHALAAGEKKPKYRTFALWKAALGLDSYGTYIDRWLDGCLTDEELDQVPSNRIKLYLRCIRDTGTIPELAEFKADVRSIRCLRLRRLRGLGPAQIAETLHADQPDKEWLRKASQNCGVPEEQVAACFAGDAFGTWQTPHVLPPLLRMLRAIEQKCESPPNWELDGVSDTFQPLRSECRITHDHPEFARLRRICKSVVEHQPMFEIVRGTRGTIRIGHSMGWSVCLESDGEPASGTSAAELARGMDPLTSDLSGCFRADLHLHTSWSDGAASLVSMAKACSQLGLAYLAVTDHSRSSKVQSGLTPVEWFRQASSLAKAKTDIPVVHGIEVDILQDGRLDLPHSLLACAGVVVGSVHSSWATNADANTRRLITAIESGCIDIIGHPTSAVTGKPGVPDYVRRPAELNWDRVFKYCAKWHVAVEFNCFPSRFDLPIALLRRALEAGCWVAFGSDAHARAHLVHLKFGQEMARRLDTDKVLNCLSYDAFRRWIHDARTRRGHLEPTAVAASRQRLLFDDPPDKHIEPVHARLAPPQQIPNGSSIVGLDLTGSDKPTGVAFLDGNRVETCSLVTDDDLIAYVQEKIPGIVSIDSPLGLPGGGKAIDPAAGIVRVAEHDLSSIGISAYPALIDSMKELTLRGIRLRNRIEAMESAPVVIESYPGAAQDILCIPRKQKSLELLREGLKDLGLRGPGLKATSHDEIDAITSALVGRYYETGRSEPMGVPKEAQLIVPKRELFEFDCPPVVCLAGRTGAGKSVVARYLAVFYGFEWCRTRELIRELLVGDTQAAAHERLFHRPVAPEGITEKDLQEFGGVILRKHGQGPLRRKLCERLESARAPVVVDAIRHPNDTADAELAGRPLVTWFVDCSEAVIQSRLSERTNGNHGKAGGKSPVDQTADLLRSEADVILANSGSLEELRWKVDDELFSFLRII